MSNTTIQIKRSSSTIQPASLNIAEPAYSYQSGKMFIGDATGSNVIVIGGKYFVDLANVTFDVANAAFDKANTANALAYNTGVGANNYSNATFLPLTGGTISNDLTVAGNLTVSGATTYVNTSTLLVGDNIFVLNNDIPSSASPSENAGMEVKRGSSANVGIIWNETTDKWTFTNDGSNYKLIASNTDIEGVAAGANGYASAVGISANLYAAAVGVSANVYAAAVGVSANAYADVVAANGSFISTGIVKVGFGGTGKTSFTSNGILYGNNSGDLKVTSAGSEGNVLLVNSSGVPVFSMLDGGSF